jgi:hypothetical protein
MTDVFISYSRKDSEFMRYLHGRLNELERDVWVDWEDIPATADWWDEIKTAIEAADAFAFIISPDSVHSEICHKEIQHAIDNNKRFIPLLYRETSDLDAPYVHSAIRSHNWISFTNESHYDDSVQKLLDSLSTEPEYVRRHTRLLVRAKEWDLQERDQSYLLTGHELDDFLKWIENSQTRQPKPTEIQLEYIYASQHRRNRRQLRVAAGAVAGFIMFIMLVGAAFFQQQQIELQNLALTQSEQEQAGTSAAVAEFQTQVRENSYTILTKGALEAENANLLSTIVAFEATVTQFSSAASDQTQAPIVSTQETSADETSTTFEATASLASAEETGATATMIILSTSDTGAQQVLATSTPIVQSSQLPSPSQQTLIPEIILEGLFVSDKEGNDNNDCRKPQAGSCKTIGAALAKAQVGDIIQVAPGIYSESLIIEQDVTILGVNPDATVLSGNFDRTVITIGIDAEVDIIDVTITGGYSASFGGGIFNEGNLYLENVSVVANSAELTGGGIANLGEILIVDSHIKQNYAPAHPDIYSSPYAWAELENVDYGIDTRVPLELPGGFETDGLLINLLVIIDTTDNDHLNLRQRPDLQAPIIIGIENGTMAIITDGPEIKSGFTWWHIRLETGEMGWAADFVDDVETIVPYEYFVDAP